MTILEEELNKINLEKLKQKRIHVIGRNEHVKTVIEYFSRNKLNIVSVLDNNKQNQGGSIDGIRIVAPCNSLLPYDSSNVIFIYSPKYWKEMEEQFESLGYSGEHIYVLDKPSEKKNRERIKKGEKTYREMITGHGNDCYIFWANCPLGDYYLLCLYLRAFCKNKGISKYILLGDAHGIEVVPPLFGMQNYLRISEAESRALLAYWKFDDAIKNRLIPLTVWQGEFRFNPCLTRQIKTMTFMDTFKHFIYGLKDKEIADFPVLSGNREKTKSMFAEKSLVPNKTVLLVPYSYSIQSLTNSFWSQLSKVLRQNGFSVAVNIGEEREINSTIDAVKISADFNQISDFMEYGGYVVGIRCGFFDITSQVKCKKVILYYEMNYKQVAWNRSDMEFCSLKAMGLSDSADEIVITDTDTMIKTIVTILKEERK